MLPWIPRRRPHHAGELEAGRPFTTPHGARVMRTMALHIIGVRWTPQVLSQCPSLAPWVNTSPVVHARGLPHGDSKVLRGQEHRRMHVAVRQFLPSRITRCLGLWWSLVEAIKDRLPAPSVRTVSLLSTSIWRLSCLWSCCPCCCQEQLPSNTMLTLAPMELLRLFSH